MGPLRRCGLLLGAVLAFAGASAPAGAQVEDILIAADEDWQHAWTGMTFPAQVGPYERRAVTKFEERDTNMGARYFAADTGTILSIYVYRPGHPDPSIWHDRAITALLLNSRMGPFDPESLSVSAFVPSGGGAPSGIRSVLDGKGDYRSTGVALYRAGEWLIKLRLSSRMLSAEALDEELVRILEGLPPVEGISRTPAYRVPQCASEPTFVEAGRIANDEDSRMRAALSEGLLGGRTIAELRQDPREDGETALGASTYCSIGEKTDRHGIYMLSDGDGPYLIALGDAGFSIGIEPAQTLDAVRKANGESVGLYRVTTADGLQVKTFLPFTAMPTPDQAANVALNEAPIVATTRPLPGDEGSETTIYTDD